MRITIDGHYEKVRIQRSVLPKQWNSAKGCSKGKGRTAKELNAYIAALSTLTLREHKELILDLTLITPKLLLKWVFGKDEKPTENHVGRNRRDGKSCKYRLCTRHHQQIHQRDEETGKSHIRYEKEGITFYELNSDFIAAFDLYLNTETNLY